MEQLQSTDAEIFRAATEALAQVLAAEPEHGLALLGTGIACARRQEWDAALEYFERAIAADPKLAPAHSNLGNLHRLAGRRKEAVAAYRQAIRLQPGLPDAHYNLSVLLGDEGLMKEAEESVRRALLFRPNYPEAHNNLGHLLLKSGKVEQALSHFRQALVWNPELVPARSNLIMALYRLGRSVEAQAEVDRLLAEHPDDLQVLRVQAAGLAQQGRLDDAEAINLKLMELQPDAADVQLNLGEVLLARDDYEGALACYRELLAKRNLPPAIAVGAMANVMLAQGNYSTARELYQQALMLDARLPPLILGLARTLLESGELRHGLETLRRVVQLMPSAADIHSSLLHFLRFDPTCTRLEWRAELARWSEQHARHGQERQAPARPKKEGEPLRLGFLAGDLERGPEAVAFVALIRELDPALTEVFIYHAARAGTVALDLQARATHWRPVAALGTADLAEQIRQDAIDVMVDLIGHGLGSRLQALSERSAPAQASWLGSFAPTGLPTMDARFSDAQLDPEGGTLTTEAGGETVVRLPAPISWRAPDQAPEVGARPAGSAFRFGVVSPLLHINAVVLDAWGEILRTLPESRLVWFSDTDKADEATRQHLTRLLLLREVEASRVEVLPKLDGVEHLAAIGGLDLVLDTFPQPLGLAALDCLWMGVPVLTLAGAESWQRVTLSVLAQAAMEDWATSTREAYVARAIAAVEQREELARLRTALRARLEAAPIMDASGFARAFEAAVAELWASALERAQGS